MSARDEQTLGWRASERSGSVFAQNFCSARRSGGLKQTPSEHHQRERERSSLRSQPPSRRLPAQPDTRRFHPHLHPAADALSTLEVPISGADRILRGAAPNSAPLWASNECAVCTPSDLTHSHLSELILGLRLKKNSNRRN